MTFATKLATLGSVAIGTTGTGIGGIYYSSLETIGNKLKGKILKNYDDFKSTWEHKYKQLPDNNETLSEDLKKIKTAKSSKDLFLYCQKNYSSTYKRIFSKKGDDLILQETEKWCTQIFKDQLSVVASVGNNGKVLAVDSDTDAAEFKENYKKLKDHNSSEGQLPKKLQDLAPNANTEADSKWKSLQSYCKEIQKKYLTTETLEDFKIAKKYCIKAGT
ncbi:hypothetical protein MHC_00775 [Mycoplasma haemocanis str. Illinois]|uniref:Uncharacterized protein n=1 Tax=Mycoplasma haemocanis (strain Illinois) TaxID=1111676 RepID=H6N5R1_MYCHN|nr:hypothetical protein [Mycoplasma haemocanis]AEW45021.1 hypothetical protein MHC_00775 [Mycoplasma haemocanis str. Illinois]